MFDIHSHILPFVDDGSKSLEKSIQMIEEEIKNGIKDIILTPHFDIYGRKCKFDIDLKEEFLKFKEEVDKRNLDVNLYLGTEIYYTKNVSLYLNKKIFPLGNSNKVLIEFSFMEKRKKIDDVLEEFANEGYQVVIAHVERYSYSSFGLVKKWKKSGAFIQVNASSFYDEKTKKLANKLLKNNLIDYIASDVHSFRKNEINRFINDYQETKYFEFK